MVYDLNKKYKSKVISVKVRCASCKVPEYNDLEKNATYTVLLSDFMSEGGDDYAMLKGLKYTSLGTKLGFNINK